MGSHSIACGSSIGGAPGPKHALLSYGHRRSPPLAMMSKRCRGTAYCHGKGVSMKHLEREVKGHHPSLISPTDNAHKERINGFATSFGRDGGISIVKFLRGKRFLVTGATGFLAKVLIEKILRTAPDVDKIYVLIKAKDQETATERLKCEILGMEIFSYLREIHGRNYEGFMLGKLVAVAGDVRKVDMGIELELASNISDEVDVIVNSAANTTFDERYDVALDINTIGPARLMSFARKFKKLKLFVQISTAYVNGQRQGHMMEKPFNMGDTIAREDYTSSEVAEKRTPALDVEAEISLAFDSRDNSHSAASTVHRMKNMGLDRAKMHGWQDTYGFTKAMGEMMLNDMRGDIPVVTIRPSIIESTWREPFPGWMEGNRMMDPVILNYGKGQLTGFLLDPDGVIDVVPADMVVNATLAAIAKHGTSTGPRMNVYHIASSVANPLLMRDLGSYLYDHFSTNPLMDTKGIPIPVHRMKLFDRMDEFDSHMRSWSDTAQRIRRLNTANSSDSMKLSERIKSICSKSVEQTKYLADIYQPYTFYRGRFDNTNTKKLIDQISEDERWMFVFDVRSIDWRDYICNVHIPGLRRHVLKGRGMYYDKFQLVGASP